MVSGLRRRMRMWCRADCTGRWRRIGWATSRFARCLRTRWILLALMNPLAPSNPATPPDWPMVSAADPLIIQQNRGLQFTPTIDGYEITHFLGEGGMGSVWRA